MDSSNKINKSNLKCFTQFFIQNVRLIAIADYSEKKFCLALKNEKRKFKKGLNYDVPLRICHLDDSLS